MGRKMTPKATGATPGALQLIEQAVNMLRHGNVPALAEYYMGTLPFILGLLYFWSDMSRNPMAAWYCGPSAAGVALLFIWMKIWHVRYCRRLWCRLQKADPEAWPLKRTLVTAARQTLLHATGAILLPLSFILAVPFGWVYAFYQNVCVVDDPTPKEMRALSRSAIDQAMLVPGQNHVMLVLMMLFGLVVMLNLAVWLLLVPYLMKSLLGIETVFSYSGMGMLNTTFLAVLCGLTYLCMDPVVKAVYVMRCFYGYAIQTGDDLKSALRPFLSAAVVVLVVGLALITEGRAGDNTMAPGDPWTAVEETTAGGHEYVDRFDENIDTVLEQRRFAWRLPREALLELPQEQGWIGSTLSWIGEQCRVLFRTMGGLIDALVEWLVEKLPNPKPSPSGKRGDHRNIVRWIFYAIGFGLAVWLIIWLVRWLKNSRPMLVDKIETAEGPAEVDLTDESVTAEDLPLDRWLAMAREMMAEGDLRKALRALYLSVLALLADHQRVTIAPYKSNLDYARELTRRAHAEPELLERFDWCIGAFERAWYGMHPVHKPTVDQFVDQQERLAALVQSNT